MRLVYKTTGKGDLTAKKIDDPTSLKDAEVLGEFESATVCATDRSNVHGTLGHGNIPRIIGHEACFRVVESKHSSVPIGSYIVLLGCDWHCFAERQKFRLVLDSSDPDDIPLEFSARATYYDPVSGVKAACVLDDWFSGCSLIEPITHVMTAFLHLSDLAFAHRILILGAGFQGQTAAVLAKIVGVRNVSIVDVNQDRIDLAVRLGFADQGFNASSSALEDIVSSTKGAYADVVFDTLPDGADELPDTRSLTARLVRPQGRWVLYGAATYMKLPTFTLLAKEVHVVGAAYDSRIITLPQRAAIMKTVLPLVRSGRIPLKPFITRTISFFDEEAVMRSVLDYGFGLDFKTEIRR